MKTLSSYIKDILITESFSSSIIQDIKKQVDTNIQVEKQKNEKEKKEWKENHPNEDVPWYIGNSKNIYPLQRILKDMGIKFDKIKNEYFEEYTDIEEAITLGKRMTAKRKNKFSGLIIPVFEVDKHNPNKYHSMLYTDHWGSTMYISLLSSYYNRYGDSKSVSPSDIEGLLKGATKVYLLNLTTHSDLMSETLKRERSEQKNGIVFNEKWYYEKVAANNKERYEKLAAKMKQQKYADDGLTEKVQKYTAKSLKYSEMFSKEPIKYSKYEYQIGSIVRACASLITSYSEYLTRKLSLASGNSYDFERNDFENKKTNISKICQQLDKLIEDLEDKISQQ